MQLWTDYEGITIDGAFPLQKLLMPEGRSAFYSTPGADGEPTVVRLIECHFDEEEILARWRCVKALNHPNFLSFEHFGQTEIDGRPVVYAVLQKVDANLAEVLDGGPLSANDVTQLATSLVAALDVLHTHGFIHEHVLPRNVFALGDVVKLRSDCIREAPEGDEGRAAKQRDVHDLASVLLQGLTQQTSIENLPPSALPAPFAQIVRHGLDGTWGLDEIRAALEAAAAPKPVAPVVAAALPVRPEPPMVPREDSRVPIRTSAQRTEGGFAPRFRWAAIAGVTALLLLIAAWVFAHTRETQAAAPGGQMTSQPAAMPAPSASAQPVAVAGPPKAAALTAVEARAGWRVIAFTYNRRSDAEGKATAMGHRHPELHPSVYTPDGRAPYLVSLGGGMERDAAYGLARRCRSLGLPRDLYVRKFGR